jgi:hypothetical protein
MEDPAALNPGWRTSSYTAQSGGGTCVEAGHVAGAVLVRDTTQHGTGPCLCVTPRDWTRFTRALRANAPLR